MKSAPMKRALGALSRPQSDDPDSYEDAYWLAAEAIGTVERLERELAEANDKVAEFVHKLSDANDRIEEIEDDLADARADSQLNSNRYNALKTQIHDLMAESLGVAGLHLNGDLAEWEWLIHNEWLSELLPLDAARAEVQGGG